MYFNGQFFVDYDGCPPLGDGKPGKRSPHSEQYDRNPPVIDFVSADPARARRLRVTTEDLRFALLWRQAQAAAANDVDGAVKKLGQKYLANAREQGKERLVALEKAIQDQKAKLVVAAVVNAK